MANHPRPLRLDGQDDAQHASWLSQSQKERGQASEAPGPALRSTNPFHHGFTPHTPHQGIASHAPISPSASAGPSHQPGGALERAPTLGSYFSIEEVPRTTYSDQDLADIARLLRNTGRTP
jgi:hypothetical protein